MSISIHSPAIHATLFAALLAATPAWATTYQFTQGGFSGGGGIQGTFIAEDIDLDGQISSFDGEVSAFSLSFSGDSVVAAFNHGMPDLFGLVYDLNSGFIGDGTSGDTEGMASNWAQTSGFDYASGLGPISMLGGRVIDVATGQISSTDQLIAVAAIPEPSTWLALLAGLPLLALRRRSIRLV